MRSVLDLGMPYAAGLLSLGAVLLAAYGAATVIYNLFLHPLRRYPGPKLWAASSIPSTFSILRGRPHTDMLALHKRYGDVVRIGPNELACSHEDAWKDIYGHLRRGQEENPKALDFAIEPPNGSLIIASRERHGPMRRLLSNAFSARAMAAQQPLINKYIDLFIRRIREHGEGGAKAVDAARWFEWTTFDVVGNLAFGEPFGCLENSSSHPWVDTFFESLRFLNTTRALRGLPFYSLLRPLYLMLFMTKDTAKKRELSRQYAEETLKKRLSLRVDRPDFVDAMINSGDKYKMNPVELTDTCGILTIAGSETTATTMAGAMYLLCAHPEVLAKLNAEVRSAFTSDGEIDINSVQNLPYMLAVLKETMRIYPAVPITLSRRAAPGGTQINGEHVPGGTVMGVWQYAAYHNPSKFLYPDSFIPERWLDDERFAGDAKNLHQPFSFGPRNCLGMNLAYTEMRMILARIIWNFDLELAPESRSWGEGQKIFFFWEKPPLWVYFKSRQV